MAILGAHPAADGTAMPQGTVKSFNHRTKAALVLDDQLRELDVSPKVFARSGLLELRLGQRVRYELGDEDDRAIASIQLITL